MRVMTVILAVLATGCTPEPDRAAVIVACEARGAYWGRMVYFGKAVAAQDTLGCFRRVLVVPTDSQ